MSTLAARLQEMSSQAPLPGLIWALRANAQGEACELEPDAAMTEIQEGWYWLHFDLTDRHTRELIQSLLGPASADRLLRDVQHVWAEGPITYGSIPDLERELGETRDSVGLLYIVIAERVLITGRRTSLFAPGTTRKLLQSGLKIETVEILFETLVHQVFEGAYDLKKPIEEETDHIEDRIVAGSVRDARPRLAKYRRAAIRLHRHVLGLRLVFQRMVQESSHVPISSGLLMAAGRMLRHSEQLDNEIVTFIDRTRLLQEEVAAMLAEETNKHLRLLSVLSILFMPPTFVAGLFGMNLNGMLFSDSDLGFWKGTTLAVAASIVVWWVLKRAGIVGRSDQD